MKITEIRVYETKGKKKSSLLAFASVTFDKAFCVTGFRIIDGSKGVFVAMPSQMGSDEEYHDTAFPVTSDFREELETAIMEKYCNDQDDKAEEAQKEEKPKKRKYGRN